MLIESDILVAYLKKEDWLKSVATRVIEDAKSGKFGRVQVSTEVFHELYYVFSEYTSLDVIATDFAHIIGLKNVEIVPATAEIYLSAINLMLMYNISSIFDAIYAATALSPMVPDNTILSTDRVYDRIPGIKRIDPRSMYSEHI
ncbi:MAG: type II toxin-antitoxin system VapC family toxin [Candidatus Baldrarchaeia archaeon]